MERLDKFYYTKDQLSNSPSRKCGVFACKEAFYREQAASLIQDVGRRLNVPQLCINTAIVYMHRFYAQQSFTVVHRNNLSIAAIFLAAKAEDNPRTLEHVIKVAHMCLHKDAPPLDVRSEAYQNKMNEVILLENILLQSLGFVVVVEHPHSFVVKVCQMIKASKELAQVSYVMATTSLQMTTLCLQYKPTVVASVCIYLACKLSEFEIDTSYFEREWYYYVDQSITSELLERLSQEFTDVLGKCKSRFLSVLGKAGVGLNGLEDIMGKPFQSNISQDAATLGACVSDNNNQESDSETHLQHYRPDKVPLSSHQSSTSATEPIKSMPQLLTTVLKPSVPRVLSCAIQPSPQPSMEKLVKLEFADSSTPQIVQKEKMAEPISNKRLAQPKDSISSMDQFIPKRPRQDVLDEVRAVIEKECRSITPFSSAIDLDSSNLQSIPDKHPNDVFQNQESILYRSKTPALVKHTASSKDKDKPKRLISIIKLRTNPTSVDKIGHLTPRIGTESSCLKQHVEYGHSSGLNTNVIHSLGKKGSSSTKVVFTPPIIKVASSCESATTNQVINTNKVLPSVIKPNESHSPMLIAHKHKAKSSLSSHGSNEIASQGNIKLIIAKDGKSNLANELVDSVNKRMRTIIKSNALVLKPHAVPSIHQSEKCSDNSSMSKQTCSQSKQISKILVKIPRDKISFGRFEADSSKALLPVKDPLRIKIQKRPMLQTLKVLKLPPNVTKEQDEIPQQITLKHADATTIYSQHRVNEMPVSIKESHAIPHQILKLRTERDISNRHKENKPSLSLFTMHAVNSAKDLVSLETGKDVKTWNIKFDHNKTIHCA